MTRLTQKVEWLAIVALITWLAASSSQAQVRPYIGFAYPAGGQQGANFQIRLGGQGLDGVNSAFVSGTGVTAKVIAYNRRFSNGDIQLLREQLRELKRETTSEEISSVPENDEDISELISRIEKRIREYVPRPANAAIAALTMVEITIAPDAEPGEREIRLATLRGLSDPLPFHVGQVPEFSREPMITGTLPVLGKEALAVRKRPADEVEEVISLPCTVNGQIAPGEVNRYRFEAQKGHRLVITTLGRQLIPYMADAVPGWFQPVLALHDSDGKEVAYNDDYRFNPDPTIFYKVPKDGQYVLEIHDSLFRGREDFVYRITIGELPVITSIFPLGGEVGEETKVQLTGWNLDEAELTVPAEDAVSGTRCLTTTANGFVSNPVPFALDTLPDFLEHEPNNAPANAQHVTLPIIINGRIDKRGDWDVFQFTAKSNDTVVVEVNARRLHSPLDSVVKLNDASGTLLAFNDDHEDLGFGLNTHQADSYLMTKLPSDGTYYVQIGDTARQGGDVYAYRLRLSAPQPDFALRLVPSSISLRSKSTAALSVYALRKDGFTDPIKLSLNDPPTGFSSSPVTLTGTQTVARLTFKTGLVAAEVPVTLSVVGRAKVGETEIEHEAVPAEDRMQAFLWKHLVPAAKLKALVFDPAYARPLRRIQPSSFRPLVNTNAAMASQATEPAEPRFTKQQIAGRQRQLNLLFDEDLLTDDFYNEKMAEIGAAMYN